MRPGKEPRLPQTLDYQPLVRQRFSVFAIIAFICAVASPVAGTRLSLLVYDLGRGTGHEQTAGQFTLVGVPVASLLLGAIAADWISCRKETLRGKPLAICAIVVSMLSALLCFFGAAG